MSERQQARVLERVRGGQACRACGAPATPYWGWSADAYEPPGGALCGACEAAEERRHESAPGMAFVRGFIRTRFPVGLQEVALSEVEETYEAMMTESPACAVSFARFCSTFFKEVYGYSASGDEECLR